MADFQSICKDIGIVAKKAARKAGEVADVADLHLKKKSLEVKLSGEYENLGKLAYKQLRRDAENTEEISARLDRIDALRAEIRSYALKIKAHQDKKKEAEKEHLEEAFEVYEFETDEE